MEPRDPLSFRYFDPENNVTVEGTIESKALSLAYYVSTPWAKKQSERFRRMHDIGNPDALYLVLCDALNNSQIAGWGPVPEWALRALYARAEADRRTTSAGVGRRGRHAGWNSKLKDLRRDLRRFVVCDALRRRMKGHSLNAVYRRAAALLKEQPNASTYRKACLRVAGLIRKHGIGAFTFVIGDTTELENTLKLALASTPDRARARTRQQVRAKLNRLEKKHGSTTE